MTVEVAWWKGWKSLTLSIYLFLFSFSLAAVSSPPPPVTPEVAWWEGWKLFSNTSSPSILSSVTSRHPRSSAGQLARPTSFLQLFSLLLNLIFFLNICTIYVFPPMFSGVSQSLWPRGLQRWDECPLYPYLSPLIVRWLRFLGGFLSLLSQLFSWRTVPCLHSALGRDLDKSSISYISLFF